MTEKDNTVSEVRLFGKTIELPAAESGAARTLEDRSNQEPPCSSDSMLQDGGLNGDAEEDQEFSESMSSPKQDHAKDSEELKDSSEYRAIAEDPNPPSETEKMVTGEDDQNETSNSQEEKPLKKPEKIIPCPRCNSMDTKFCYFNNYNVNQPRHFCKNCQRYWTAGGTMRNVPVGAGRRKNKNSVPQYGHITIPEALQSAHHAAVNPKGTLLTFDSDSPLCESMASVLNIVDKTNSRNGFHRPEEMEMSVRSKESGDDSSTTASSSKDEVGKKPKMMPNGHPLPHQVPCYPGGPWPYPWNPVQWNSAVSPPSFPVPFYAAAPPPYWACAVPGAWNVPYVMQQLPTALQTPPSPNSPALGKHLREETAPKTANAEEGEAKETNLERNLWFPKTLRIDDPGEAAKSSIWATLGIKNERAGAVGASGGGSGLFKVFQPQSKGDEKSLGSEASTVLQANPAALSRSLNFHENS
ncbi:hypothetical protein SASPL_142197 [Salvia splendens]|uniref:Dof-type domain-containing protein n=1 Tax=Salvia splendens TaxID=180675 RepID=A0A8X8Z9K7_SALSN|nr:cyclic dof factor 2-like [Salvia splendens]KAG6396059.1 hypothetical protein SASPL_142197 [Salvia splendens]